MECKSCKRNYPNMIGRNCTECGRRFIGVIDLCGPCFYAQEDAIKNAKDAEIIEEVKEDVVIEEVPVVSEETSIEKKPFCDSCDSKGVRHKKGCPKAKK